MNYDKLIGKSKEFNEQLSDLKEQLYSGLKEFYNLPKLRKESLYIESEFNSALQIYFLDYIYDQQDLYNHYDQQFYRVMEDNHDDIINLTINKKSSETLNEKAIRFPLKNKGITLKSEYLPFEEELKRIEELSKEFKNKNDREALANLKKGKYFNSKYGHDNYNSDNQSSLDHSK